MNRILIVDDEQVIREALQKLLRRNQFEADVAESAEQAGSMLASKDYDLVLADVRLPGKPGTSLIGCQAPVLVMTSYASVPLAVEAMKLGAADYIAKPFDHEELLMLIRRILSQQQAKRATKALKTDLANTWPTGSMIGSCAAMQEVKNQIGKVAPTAASVLILGESGTGKELVARAIHEQSQRASAPFIAVNCAAIPENLVESELFGHVKGAFTGADKARVGMIQSADGGTLFLDEIGELPTSAQARLLRVLQDGEVRAVGQDHPRQVNMRLLAATNRDLDQMVQNGQFRADLYFRLQVLEIRLPPLRARQKDLRSLAENLLSAACRQLNKAPMTLSAGAISALQEYPWPGNVRELKNALERAVILTEGQQIEAGLLGLDGKAPQARNPELSLEDYFRQFVLANQGRMTETELATKLGISRKTLWERRQRLGLPKP